MITIKKHKGGRRAPQPNHPFKKMLFGRAHSKPIDIREFDRLEGDKRLDNIKRSKIKKQFCKFPGKEKSYG